MDDGRISRRRVLQAAASVGLAVGAAGCTGTDPTDERDGQRDATNTTAGTDSATGVTTASPTREPTTAASTGSTGSGATASDGTASKTTTGTTDAAERGTHTVGMYTDLYFDPIGLYIEPGETVSFELVSGAHSATAYHPDNEGALDRRIPRRAPSWNTDVFNKGGTFRNITFETQGTHDYYCIPHKYRMIGRIVVGEPGGPAVETPNPDGDLPDSERIVEEKSISYEAFQESGR